MDSDTKRQIVLRLREIAELIERTIPNISSPGFPEHTMCVCHAHRRGETTGGWNCPAHGHML